MTEHKLRRIPVVGRDERLVGIVGLADLARSDLGTGTAKQTLAGVTEPMHEPRRFPAGPATAR